MTIEIINKTKEEIGLSDKEITTLIEASLSKFDLTASSLIEIIFVNDQEIAQLNSQFRNKKSSTDVLSFPQDQFKVEKNILGSIVICPEVVKLKSETLEQVIKHGLIHLLGFDHELNLKEWESAAKKINCTY